MNRTSKWVAFAILFLGGFNAALPAFGWATPIETVHGVFIDNALVMLYLLILVATGTTAALTRNTDAVRFAALIALLASLGVISAGVNPYLLLDVGEALRLLLYSAFVLLAAHWARAQGGSFVLRSYLFGVAVGGAINLYYSFTVPELVVGLLPTLRARNGAGGTIAIGLGLGALLMMIRRTRLDAVAAVAALLIGVAAVAISFSKTALLIGFCGAAAWVLVLLHGVARRHAGIILGAGAAALVAATVFAWRAEDTATYAAEVVRYAAIKFAGFDMLSKYGGGDRYKYALGVGEIVAAHPLTGVSYGGFYDAITRTYNYATGEMAVENPNLTAMGVANPHNSFLYYAAANGIPGIVLVTLIFVRFLGSLFRSLDGHGVTGRGVWLCLALAYFIYGMTLPTLLDTDVLYVPAAVALAAVGLRAARARSRAALDSAAIDVRPAPA